MSPRAVPEADGLRRFRRLFLACCFAALPCGALEGVVISEIHYHPPEGFDLEFVELHNPGPREVALDGWSLGGGIRFSFPPGSSIEAGGHVLVSRNPAALREHFGLPPEGLLGGFDGRLSNGGETLVLTDAVGNVIDQVRYEDDPPWAGAADGEGASLQRVCSSFPSSHPRNWHGESGSAPTPLGPGPVSGCPPPGLLPPAIEIHEIHYHPRNDNDGREEFVELRNNTDRAVNLKGFAFVDGIEFTFREDFLLGPGELVAICRDREFMRTTHGVATVAGDFSGGLSNGGERITLVDGAGLLADSVRYGDAGDWPAAADGEGHSLEKIVPGRPSDDPASWGASLYRASREWQSTSVTGPATSGQLVLHLDGEGEFLVDNVRVEEVGSPDRPFISNGTFDDGLLSWTLAGNHAETTWAPAGGPDGSAALLLRSSGRGSGPWDGVWIRLAPDPLRDGTLYRVSLDFRYVRGSPGLCVQLAGSREGEGLYWKLPGGPFMTPGARNSVSAERRPPHVSHVRRFPREPDSTDVTWIGASVRGDTDITAVTLLYRPDGGIETALEMRDDGQHLDAFPGDGIYGAGIPPLPHNTMVIFRIQVETGNGLASRSPPPADPSEYHGFHVSDDRPESKLPVYTLFLAHPTLTSPADLVRSVNCVDYRTASFAHRGDLYYNVGIRRRGRSVCLATKPYLKVRFNRGHLFRGRRRVNLQSMWTDKSLVREILAWEVFRDLGLPHFEEEHVRLHFNGQYFGLYADLENPGRRFLERNRLDREGHLYKALRSGEEFKTTYEDSYEKETSEDGDFTDLTGFLHDLHGTPAEELARFFSQRIDEDRLIDYQLAQTLINNSDHARKNHFLYHDPGKDRWQVLAWDLDLTFGKVWGQAGGVYHDRLHIPGNNPWYTTTVDGAAGNHLLDSFFSRAGTWYRRAYLVRLWDALHEKYTEELYTRRLSALRDLLLEEQELDIAAWGRTPASVDDPEAPAEFEPNLERILEHLRARRAFLLDYLEQRSQFTGHESLKITEVLADPPDGEGEFLELWNPSGREVEISGWRIDGIGHVFPAGTRLEENEIIVVARNPGAIGPGVAPGVRVFGPYPGRLDNDGETLRVRDAGPGHPATVDLLRYGSGDGWPVVADGPGHSIELTGVSRHRDNDPPENWRASPHPGGSPGTIDGITPGRTFLRGDANSDGGLNISDAVEILTYLFRRGPPPSCLEALDADGSGKIVISDAVFLLLYLFVEPPPSLPLPGACLRSATASCEASTCQPPNG